MNVAEINSEIERLKEERARLLNQNKFESEAEVQSLRWTKECYARLEINSLVSAGIPAYTITISGRTVPHTVQAITIMGESNLYEENMMYGKSFSSDYYSFFTSSEKMLLEFLERVEFDKFDFNERHLRVLLEAKATKERCEP